jgi:hypothetical protein
MIYARSCLFGEGDDDPYVRTAFMGAVLGHSKGKRVGCMFTINGTLFVEIAAPIYVILDREGRVRRISCLSSRKRGEEYIPGDFEVQHIYSEVE